ncbi:MAG: 2-oxo-hepta-3-ene-1,7-dioic acid hydratase, partial [Paracoccaceae bacterium]
KIGLTSKAMQSALNIDIPDSGVLFDDMLFDHDGLVPKDRFIQPRVEAEIAFVFKSPLGGAHLSAEDVINATDYVTPSLEILDTRIVRQDPQSGKARTVLDTISDNAANAGVVLGAEKHKISSHDLRWVGAIVSRDKEVEETGLGAGVLNDPVTSVLWLAQRMAQYGQKIEPGQIVLSGSFIRPIECPSGSHIHADFGPFGQVAISFE